MQNQGFFVWPDAPEKDLYSVCVHCGFCLEVCPTYQQLGNENESPRGRVYLIKAVGQGIMPLDQAVIDPVFNCLDCRACETVCPSGVKVGTLIEEARGQALYAQPKTGAAKLTHEFFLHGVFPSPRKLGVARKLLRFYQRSGLQRALRNSGALRLLPKHLREMEAVLPKVSAQSARTALSVEVQEPVVQAKATVGLFTGCVMDVLFSEINLATARVAQRNQLRVKVPKEQICCGALQVHAGDREQARKMARRNIDVFLEAEVDYIVINAAGCGAAMKEYPELFNDDPEYFAKAQKFAQKVRDIAEVLIEVGFDPPKARLKRTVTYHDACHLAHAQQIRSQPRELLRAIEGIHLIEMKDSDRCCGSAGIYNLTHKEMALQLRERKIADLPREAEAVAMGNPGCMLQIKAGIQAGQLDMEVVHTIELLDEAYRLEREEA
ncbi:(Fe-S)-binding protein [Sulfoacidibacillus thermotolerans]|uniref:Glycolate oxidase iron-sulfur subunit n=1 Tax=Sulfoacidibacillus thermotolerans TaxID=1765684 RepID=A0A2U3D9C9_SULT2|nr:glycolate oxidase [Sulfoacidibacillus thermotolerans]